MKKEATLDIGEAHPMANSAFKFVKREITPNIIESISSSALSGSRTAEICLSTYERMTSGLPVSDRYILGLAWLIKGIKDGT